MTPFRTTLVLSGGLLFAGLGLQPAFAITGCTNMYLQGTYNAQISNANFLSVISAVNADASGTGSTTSTGSGGSTGAAASSSVSSTFPGSLSSKTPYAGRYYFDGNGNVVGMQATAAAGVPPNAIVGTYAVDTNCNAKISLNGGRSFNAVITNQGQTVLFLESDASGIGAVGTMERSAGFCSSTNFPQSFGFALSGASKVTAASTSDGGGMSGGTSSGGTAAATATQFAPYALVGTISLDGNGGFTMTSWSTSTSGKAAVSQANRSGSYTIATDCSISLSFNTSSSGGSTGSVSAPLTFFNGLLPSASNGNSNMAATGLITVQAGDGVALTGVVIPQ